MQQRQAFPYLGVLCVLPVVGCSFRADSLEVDVSVHTILGMSSLNASTSKIFYENKSPNSYYFVVGAGLGALLLMKNDHTDAFPTVNFPIRCGKQWANGFADLGFNVTYIVPLPELRCGLSF